MREFFQTSGGPVALVGGGGGAVAFRQVGGERDTAEGKLKPAAENPWYVLATIYDDERGKVADWRVAEKNRQAWNAWACQNLSKDDCAALAEAIGLEANELQSWPEIEKEVKARFKRRIKSGATLPDVEKEVDCRGIRFDGNTVWAKSVFTQTALFDSAIFTQAARFDGAIFTQFARFADAVFKHHAYFNHATFKRTVGFSGTTFEKAAHFNPTTFTQDVHFDNVTFMKASHFDGATFMQGGHFGDAVFEQTACFNGATFAQDTYFSRATFVQLAGFHRTAFTEAIRFDRAIFTRAARFNSATFAGRSYFVGTRFLGAPLSHSTQTSFVDAEFQRPITFRQAEFQFCYPDWTGTILSDRINLTTQDTGEADDEDVEGNPVKRFARYWPKMSKPTMQEAVAARDSCAAMRHALNQQGLPEAEHFFFRKEMGFAGRIGGWWQRLPYRFFGSVSGYGHSIAWPTYWLAIVLLSGGIWFAGYFRSPVFQSLGLDIYEPHLTGLGFSIANTFPFLGYGRLHFGSDFVEGFGVVHKIVAGAQTVSGILLLFFLGLGLRTRFRLR